MEQSSKLTLTNIIKAYLSLTKPGIIMGNSITAIGGFALACKGHIAPMLFLNMLIGLGLVIASGCSINNYIDRELDAKMKRTRNRPLVTKIIPANHAIILATILGSIGVYILFAFVNTLTMLMALIGLFVYVALYSFSKYYTTQATLIGSIAGAIPPVVGYCAVANRLDTAALILFMMIVMWQMPHFFAIAIYRLEDYIAAAIPVLPNKKTIATTKVHMLFYVIGFIIVSCMLTAYQYTGYIYLIVALTLGISWLIMSIKGFKSANDKLWARKMFIFSLVIVMTIFVVIPFDVV